MPPDPTGIHAPTIVRSEEREAQSSAGLPGGQQSRDPKLLGPGDGAGTTQGAVRASPPKAQRVLRPAPGEWAIRTIGQKPKEPNCPNWRNQTDWPDTQIVLEAPQITCPLSRMPPTQGSVCLYRAGAPGAAAEAPLCPPVSCSQWVTTIATRAPSNLRACCGPSSCLFPESPQAVFSGTPSWVSAPSSEDPHARNTECHLACRQSTPRLCSPPFAPNMLFLAESTAWVLSLTCNARIPNKAFKFGRRGPGPHQPLDAAAVQPPVSAPTTHHVRLDELALQARFAQTGSSLSRASWRLLYPGDPRTLAITCRNHGCIVTPAIGSSQALRSSRWSPSAEPAGEKALEGVGMDPIIPTPGDPLPPSPICSPPPWRQASLPARPRGPGPRPHP
ncbi:uncharacterized protein LOC130848795 [Hippopotamus amphibius kiboko]|uniref:uncharacterized protein LOC130848795 n=1 Tax=Hippopotamus amphibius kiboko TaxID=575201 RepID=UPI0025978D11|nr:uncharacterized protein LOC130848795 [Hippopotamus amphibius kiboko]